MGAVSVGLKQANGPRCYGRGLAAARSVYLSAGPAVLGGSHGARSASDYGASLTSA